MNDVNRDAQLIETEAAGWLACQDGERYTPALRRQFAAWLDADVRHRVAYLRLRAAWRRADALARQLPAVAPRRRWRHAVAGWRVAAALVVACGLGLSMSPVSDWRPDQRYATGIGENRTIALADGSRLTLNTATRLRAAPGTARKVWLDSGEAYFDIAHDPAHPFVVQAGADSVTVLGTRFSVRRDGDDTRVLVEQGRVRVNARGASVNLTRNQEAHAGSGGIVRADRTRSGTAQALAWREGRLVFDRTPLREAVAEFNRYNQRQLVLDGAAGDILIGGSFAPSNIDGFVRLLEQGFGVHARRGPRRIVLSH